MTEKLLIGAVIAIGYCLAQVASAYSWRLVIDAVEALG